MSARLTKSDFILYLKCPKSLWLLKNKPESYPFGEFSAFLQKITREGYEVERYVKAYFNRSPDRRVSFQEVFETAEGLFARADALENMDDGRCVLYEIKSSTRVKTDPTQNHIMDAAFQKICAERSGRHIDAVYIVHLNGGYVRCGEIDPSELLTFTDVSANVRAIEADLSSQIDRVLEFLSERTIDRSKCSCLRNSRAHHCDTFEVFNPNIPKPSIYSLPRLSQTKRNELVTMGIFDLLDIPKDYTLSSNQLAVLQAARAGAPTIDRRAVREFLDGWQFPLYFFDFETFASAVPIVDGASPHKHFPVQYSLHVLHENGHLEHREFLEREARLPMRLLEALKDDIGPTGNIVSWHASFEKTQNKEMAVLFPEFSDFLKDMNERTVDLEDVFKSSYVDSRFDGSTSIKKVLPVLCPELSYKGLEVKDGASAMDAWEQMIRATGEEADRRAEALLSYCKLDTLAMVEIYRFLTAL